MDNIIFEDPSKLQKPSKRNLGYLTQPRDDRYELPMTFAVGGIGEPLRSPADAVSSARLPMTSKLPDNMQRQEATHEAEARQGGTTEMAHSGWELSSLCRDFVLDPSTVENLTSDHDSLFSTPEPDPEIGLQVVDSLPHEPAQTIAIGNEEHEEGDRARMCLNASIIDPHEASRLPQLASHPTSPLLESMISRSSSAWQVGMPEIGQATGFPGQQQSPPTPPPDQAHDGRAARSDMVMQQDECESRVTLRGPNPEPSQRERPSRKESLVCETQQTRAITALSRTTLALVDDSEHQSESEPRQSAPQRMMAESKAPARVSRKPRTRSLHPEVIIPRRTSLAPSKQISPSNGGRPAELESHAKSRKSSANQSHRPWEVTSSAGHKRQHFEEDDSLSPGSHQRRIKHRSDLVTSADVLSELDKADIVGHSSEETCDEWDWEQQTSIAPASVHSFGELDDDLANSDRARQGDAGKITDHDLKIRRCRLTSNARRNDTTTNCDIPTGPMRMKVQQVMPADAAFVTIFVDDPVQLRTSLESPATWARSCGLSSTHTTLTNVTVSPAESHSWLVTATLSWIDGSAHGGRAYCRSNRSCSPNSEAGSVYRSGEDEKETRRMKRGHWTRKEDDNLRRWKRIGRPWSWICDQFSDRTEAAVKSHWFVVLAPQETAAESKT